MTAVIYRTTALCLLSILITSVAAAQVSTYNTVYRPADASYRVFETEHFDMIYQEGAFEEAVRTAGVLEETLAGTRALVGLDPDQRLAMPVIVNAYNDRANALLSPAPFKQEIDHAGIMNNTFPVGISSWFRLVAPHELTHAAHAEIDAPIGVGWLLRRAAPDWGRGLNLSIPPGMTEGVAVYRESEIEEDGGRLNRPLFRMQYEAAMAGENPWSLAQMLEAPRFSRPFDRFYNGGGHLFSYLHAGDSDFFRSSTRFYNRFPFLGYGVALWYGTGQRPGQIHSRLLAEFRELEAQRIAEDGPFTGGDVLLGGEGADYRRPTWLNDSTLVTHGSEYNVRPGFYRVNVPTGEHDLVSNQSLTENRYFRLSNDSTRIYFSRYERNTWAAVQAHADVYALPLAADRADRLSMRQRLHAPFQVNESVFAFQIDGDTNHLVELRDERTTVRLTDLPRSLFREASQDATSGRVVVLLNIEGRQGLYEMEQQAEEWSLDPLVLFADGDVYDFSWTADGDFLVFSADPGGRANAFAYEFATGEVRQLTNARFAIIEPSVSPDGSNLAFIDYRDEAHRLVVESFQPEQGESIPDAWLMTAGAAQDLLERVALPFQVDLAGVTEDETRPYRPVEYLWPRVIYPTAYPSEPGSYANLLAATTLGAGLGLATEGVDPLQKSIFRGETFYRAGRMWGSMSVRTASYRLRPEVTLYRRPRTATASVVDERGNVVGTREIGIDERAAALNLSLPVTHSDNVFRTSSTYFLNSRLRQTQPFDPDDGAIGESTLRGTFQPGMAFGYRLQQNPRDLIPNTGLVFSTLAEVDVWSTNAAISRGIQSRLSAYLPLLKQTNGGVQLNAALLSQNRGIFSTRAFVPRGYETMGLPPGTHARFDAEVIQPLWFIDDGFVLLPFFADVFFAYGFAQTMLPVDSALGVTRSSLGGGFGFQFRLFSHVHVETRLGLAYRPEEASLGWTWR